MNRRPRTILLALVPALLAMLVPATPARAADPPFIGWSAALPPIVWKYDASSSDDCVAGRFSCVRATIRKMQRRFDPLAAQCTHSAVFSLAYLRTTEKYLVTAQTPQFYQDPRFVNHEDAAFAAMYFTAYDAFAAGRLARVPPVWRTTFRAGEERRVSGTGDLLLGMNAHVNRDLPFVLAKIGLVAPNGMSRKTDHDKINVMLNMVVEMLIDEEAERFDPDIKIKPAPPYGVGYTGLLEVLQAWREAAWIAAEQLVTAPNAAARARVAAAIEANAEANAQEIITATAYTPLTSTGPRDSYCAAHVGTGG